MAAESQRSGWSPVSDFCNGWVGVGNCIRLVSLLWQTLMECGRGGQIPNQISQSNLKIVWDKDLNRGQIWNRNFLWNLKSSKTKSEVKSEIFSDKVTPGFNCIQVVHSQHFVIHSFSLHDDSVWNLHETLNVIITTDILFDTILTFFALLCLKRKHIVKCIHRTLIWQRVWKSSK